jgi:hypothetical protein
MVWGMLGLNDTVKVSKRGARKDTGKVVTLPMDSNNAVVEYPDGEQVTVRIGDVRKTKSKS